MAATTTEVLMGLGSFSLDVDWDAETWAEVAAGAHLQIYEGERLVFTGAITKPTPGRDSIALAGRSLEYWLGLDASGPTVEDRWYVSGQNCLNNGDFAAGLDHWQIPSGGIWYLDTSSPGHVATRAAAYNDPSGLTSPVYNIDDQPLVSDQSLDIAPGYRFTSTATVVHDTTEHVGRLRFRHTYSGVHFAHPDLASPYSAWAEPLGVDIHKETDPSGLVKGPVLRCQTSVPDLVANPSFEDPAGVGSLNGYWELAGSWLVASDGGHNGNHYVHTDGGPAFKELINNSDGHNGSPASTRAVIAGETYRAWVVARVNPGSDGLSGRPATDGKCNVMIGLTGPGTVDTFLETPYITSDSNSPAEWRLSYIEFVVPDGKTGAVIQVRTLGQTTGRWDFDDLTFIKVQGYVDSVSGAAVPGISGRTYRWTVPYRSDASVTEGSVQLNMVCTSLGGRDVLTIQGLPLAVTDGLLQSASWDFTMPGGYDYFTPQVEVRDLHGGAYFLGQGTIVDIDSKTAVFEAITTLTVPVPVTGTLVSTPPVGAKTCQFSIVAEPYALGWRVSQCVTRRSGDVYAYGQQVAQDVCVHPQTGLKTLNAGQIYDAGILLADWHVLNMTNRAILAHLSNGGLVLPYREWRTGPDGYLAWGLPEEIFTDHPDIVLGPDDFFLLGPIQAAGSNNEDAISDVKLLGASYTKLDGTTVQIVGRATNPPGTAVDYFGNPIRRMLVNSNTAIDIPSVADRYADYLAARAQFAIRAAGKAGGGTVGVRRLPGQARTLRSGQPLGVGASPAITIELADPRVLGPVVAGDWVYLWDGDRLEDSDYELPLPDGRLVHPAQKRVLSKTTKYGGGAARAFLRRPDGSLYPDDGVGLRYRPEAATTVTMELGDLLTEFAVAPEGGDAAAQFLRYLASTPTR